MRLVVVVRLERLCKYGMEGERKIVLMLELEIKIYRILRLNIGD